jgi:hypothetical protein
LHDFDNDQRRRRARIDMSDRTLAEARRVTPSSISSTALLPSLMIFWVSIAILPTRLMTYWRRTRGRTNHRSSTCAIGRASRTAG